MTRELTFAIRRHGAVGVWGIVTFETTVPIHSFPLQYVPSNPVRNGIRSGLGGAGYNVASALNALGTAVTFNTVVGHDAMGDVVRHKLSSDINVTFADTNGTPQSVVLYDDTGAREILNDLKDAPDATLGGWSQLDQSDVSAAIITNIEGNRAFLSKAKRSGVPIVTDVHTMAKLDDPYNGDFCAAADILFLSDALITIDRRNWLQSVASKYENPLVILGMGAEGVLMAENAGTKISHVPAFAPRPVLSTLGAGDALLAAFVSSLVSGQSAVASLHRAAVFAGNKIGEIGGTAGFATSAELTVLTRAAFGEVFDGIAPL